MVGCLTIIICIILLVLVVKFPLFMIGVGIVIWGIYEFNINRQLKAKSKLIPIIISFGLILSFSGCVLSINDDSSKEDVKSTKESKKIEQNENKTKAVNVSSEPKDQAKKTKKKSSSEDKLIPVSLIETVDGDTIKIKYKGKEETLRYLLIDTPESKKPGTCVQPFAKSAYNKNKQIVNSGKLSIEFENSNKRDKYGRLLAYVYVDGKSVQEKLLKGGYARVAYIYDPPYKHLSIYKKDESIAKDKKLNIWSKSSYVTDKGFKGCVSEPSKKDNSNSATHTNTPTSNSNSAPASTPTSSGSEYFANCTELRTKYPSGVPSTHPAYQSKMDRDHDNWACER